MARLILITGCSGAGKSTLADALRRDGDLVVEEPGRRIIAEERARGGDATLWENPAAFARRAVAMAIADLRDHVHEEGPVLFDRGLIDAAVALRHETGVPLHETIADAPRYADRVFLAAPWRDLFRSDETRRHGFAEAVAEFERIEAALSELVYEALYLPQTSVADRAAFVRASLVD